MDKTQNVTCPLPGFDGVVLVLNMMASTEDWDTWMRSLGTEGAECVVAAVQGWDTERYGQPFTRTTPMAFSLWATKRGVVDAFTQYANDPN